MSLARSEPPIRVPAQSGLAFAPRGRAIRGYRAGAAPFCLASVSRHVGPVCRLVRPSDPLLAPVAVWGRSSLPRPHRPCVCDGCPVSPFVLHVAALPRTSSKVVAVGGLFSDRHVRRLCRCAFAA